MNKFDNYLDIPALNDEQVSLFWEQTSYNHSTNCIEWITAVKKGSRYYGNFTISGKPYFAHRVSYTIAKGQIPKGLIICHRCDNRACVNPEHLWADTHKNNMKDMVEKKRSTGKRYIRYKDKVYNNSYVAAINHHYNSGSEVLALADNNLHPNWKRATKEEYIEYMKNR